MKQTVANEASTNKRNYNQTEKVNVMNTNVTLGKEDLKGMNAEMLLAVPMSAIEDIKPFTTFPAGAFVFTVTRSEVGKIERGDNSFIGPVVELSLKTVLELTDKSGETAAPEAGTVFESSSTLDEKLQYFATTWRPVAAQLGVGNGTLKEWLAAFAGKDITAMITHTKDKEGKLDSKGKPIFYARLADPKLV